MRAVYEHVAQFQQPGADEPDPRFEPATPTRPDELRCCAGARRIVVKVGSSLVTNEGRGLDAAGDRRLVPRRWRSWRAQGRELVMVSSGAIAEGMKRLGWTTPPEATARAAGRRRGRPDGPGADVRDQLREHGLRSAQVLLTHADLADRERYLNARSTLLHAAGAEASSR